MAIHLPPPENTLQALTPSCFLLEISTFGLLKAFLGFSPPPSLAQIRQQIIWWMAGKQLAGLKAMYGGWWNSTITP